MSQWLRGQSDRIHGVLRIVAGVLFACHGAQKLFGVLGGDGVPLLSRLGIAGVIEFFGGGLMRSACSHPTSRSSRAVKWPSRIFWRTRHRDSGRFQNRGELAALYCFLFLYIAARGADPLSLDRLLKGHRTQEPAS